LSADLAAVDAVQLLEVPLACVDRPELTHLVDEGSPRDDRLSAGARVTDACVIEAEAPPRSDRESLGVVAHDGTLLRVRLLEYGPEPGREQSTARVPMAYSILLSPPARSAWNTDVFSLRGVGKPPDDITEPVSLRAATSECAGRVARKPLPHARQMPSMELATLSPSAR
jgi:hypothetical protein